MPSDFEGVLTEIKVANGEFAAVGDLLGIVSPQEGGGTGGNSRASASVHSGAESTAASAVAQTPKNSDWIMPAAERILSEYKISADAITPTGPGGRLLKEDVLNYIQAKGLKPSESSTDTASDSAADRPAVTAPARPAPTAPAPSRTTADLAPLNAEREEKSVPMSMIRRTIAKRLVEAQQTAALLTTFNEINMQPVKDLRSKYKEAFLNKHGVKLGFMSFFAKAVVEGLRRYPAINSEIRGDQVITKNYHDIGVAIGGGKGLVLSLIHI